MSYSMTDPSGGYFDPTTGMYVPASNMPTKQQATTPNGFSGAGNALSAVGQAIAPAMFQGANGAPPMPTPPAQVQPPAAAPQQGPVAAAMGPPQAPPQQPPPPVAQALQQPPVAGREATQQPPQASSPTGAVGAPSSDYYATAQPPQDPQQQQILAAAAAKYGVPPQVAQWVGYHESGWNPGAANPQSGTQGAWQFKPGTAQQYGVQNPNDFGQSTDGAMHYLSDLAKKNGGDWTQAVQQYGTFSTGMGADRDAAAKTGFQKFMGLPGSSQGPMLAGTTTQPPPSGPDMGPTGFGNFGGQSGGFDPMQDPAIARVKAMAQAFGVKPISNSDKLLAMASGFLGGNGPAKSLAGGLGAIPQMNMAANKQGEELANLGIQSQYHDALLGMTGTRIGLQADSPAGPQQISTGADGKPVYMTPLKNGSFRQDSGPISAVQGVQNRANVPLQTELASGKAGGVDQAKDTQDDINQMYEAAQEAPTRDMQLNQLQQLVQSGQAGSGPGLAALKRGIANYFDVDLSSIGGPSATGAQLAGAIASQQRGSGIMGKNMRTQREFNTVMQGLPNIDSMNPQVLNDTVNRLKNLNDLSHTMAQNFLALPADQRSAMRTNQDQFQAWSQGQAQSWRDKVQQNGGLYGQGAPQAPAPGTTPTGGTKGATPTLRYDQASGRMVPM